MTAKEANEKYIELLEMVSQNYRLIFDAWQKSNSVNISDLVEELRLKEKSYIFTAVISELVYIMIVFSLVTGTVLLYKSFIKDHYYPVFLLVFCLLLAMSIYLVDRIKNVYRFRAIEEKRKTSMRLDNLLTLLKRDLTLFYDKDTAINDQTLYNKILETAISIIRSQRSLLKLTLNGSVILNVEFVEKDAKILILLRASLSEKIEAAKRFGREINPNLVLNKALTMS